MHTPVTEELSAGIISFELDGMSTEDGKEQLQKRGIRSIAPYPSEQLRLTPGIINTHEEIDQALATLRSLVP